MAERRQRAIDELSLHQETIKSLETESENLKSMAENPENDKVIRRFIRQRRSQISDSMKLTKELVLKLNNDITELDRLIAQKPITETSEVMSRDESRVKLGEIKSTLDDINFKIKDLDNEMETQKMLSKESAYEEITKKNMQQILQKREKYITHRAKLASMVSKLEAKIGPESLPSIRGVPPIMPPPLYLPSEFERPARAPIEPPARAPIEPPVKAKLPLLKR